MEEVKGYLGHSSIRVTSDRYGHLFPNVRAALADALDGTFRTSAHPTAPPTCPSAALDAVAAELNGRPRQTLGFKTPSQALDEALRMTT
jgi:hypothetical protein